MSTSVQKLGKNIGGYFGELIDIRRVNAHIERVASETGWQVEPFLDRGEVRLVGLKRGLKQAQKVVYLSTGIHGDEPAGPLAALKLLEEDQWPAHLGVLFCPCLNPTGFLTGRRENEHGFDLNRHYRNPQAEEIVAHTRWLEQQPMFDLSLCLHEDWESQGFYVYELNPENQCSLAETIVKGVEHVCPVDYSDLIEGRPAQHGIIRPVPDLEGRPDWPEAFFLISRKSHLSYTLEAPSDYPLSVRVNALVEGTRAALRRFGSSEPEQ